MTSLSDLQNKKILILGLGSEGMDNLIFFQKNISCKLLGIADACSFDSLDKKQQQKIQKGVNLHFGKNYLSAIKKYDVIVKSPGIPMSLIKITKNQIVTSQTDLFLSNYKGVVIGVTGTKGKSTTSLILHKVLENSGFKSYLIGNIGTPVLSLLKKSKKDDIYIYELSSFQLETTTESPHISIFLNLFIDHLDKHKNFNEYLSAKSKITLFQKEGDFFIYNIDDKNINKIAKKTKAKKIPFSPNKRQKGIATPLDPIFIVAKILKIKKEIIKKVLSEFKGLPHRTEFVRKHNNVDFYDDSASTIPEATIRAVKDLKKVQSLILGGTDKGADISEMLKFLQKSDVLNIAIFEGSKPIIEEKMKKAGKNIFIASSMKDAVSFCFQNTKKGKICLLSPAFASFNIFKNYKDRGEQFKKCVNEIK
jgi:UDP-N-acetylmuramoylalanine--D-glutamate ligase